MKKANKTLQWETDFLYLLNNSAAATLSVKFFMWTLIYKLLDALD